MDLLFFFGNGETKAKNIPIFLHTKELEKEREHKTLVAEENDTALAVGAYDCTSSFLQCAHERQARISTLEAC